MPIQEPDLRVKTNVEIAVRRFHADPAGDIIADGGIRGFYEPWQTQEVHNLLTTAGRDFLHVQGYASSVGTNGGNYLALSTNAGGASAAHTSVAGEITNNGLQRAQGSIAHTNDQTTSTVSKTFTAGASFTAVQLAGLLTASSTGTLVHEATFSSVNLENLDQLSVVWSLSLS